MPTTEILLTVANLLLLMSLSRMAWKLRTARNIAMRLLTDDLFYYETRGELIQKNVESARLVWGRVRVSSVMQIPVTIPQDPKAAWAVALHTATRMPNRQSDSISRRARPLPESAASILEAPYSLWVSTFASKDKPWSPTVLMNEDNKTTTDTKRTAKQASSGKELLSTGFMSHAMSCK